MIHEYNFIQFSHGGFVVKFLKLSLFKILSRASHCKGFSMETVDSFYVKKLNFSKGLSFFQVSYIFKVTETLA